MNHFYLLDKIILYIFLVINNMEKIVVKYGHCSFCGVSENCEYELEENISKTIYEGENLDIKTFELFILDYLITKKEISYKIIMYELINQYYKKGIKIVNLI